MHEHGEVVKRPRVRKPETEAVREARLAAKRESQSRYRERHHEEVLAAKRLARLKDSARRTQQCPDGQEPDLERYESDRLASLESRREAAANRLTYKPRAEMTPEERERQRARLRKFYADHREWDLARSRAYKAAHPEKVREYERRIRAKVKAKDPEAYRQKQRAARQRRILCRLGLPFAPTYQLAAALRQNEIYAAAAAIVPTHYAPHRRNDLISELVLAVLDGHVQLGDLATKGKAIMRKWLSANSSFDTVSLDTPLYDDGRETLIDRITDTGW